MGKVVGKMSIPYQRTLLSKQVELGRKVGRRKSWESPCSAKASSSCTPNCGLETLMKVGV